MRRLAQWKITGGLLAKTLARLLGFQQAPQEDGAGKRWTLGMLKGNEHKEVFFVSDACHPQTIDVVQTRAAVRRDIQGFAETYAGRAEEANGSPDLRAALFQVAERIPGVQITEDTTDPAGRPATRLDFPEPSSELLGRFVFGAATQRLFVPLPAQEPAAR